MVLELSVLVAPKDTLIFSSTASCCFFSATVSKPHNVTATRRHSLCWFFFIMPARSCLGLRMSLWPSTIDGAVNGWNFNSDWALSWMCGQWQGVCEAADRDLHLEHAVQLWLHPPNSFSGISQPVKAVSQQEVDTVKKWLCVIKKKKNTSRLYICWP